MAKTDKYTDKGTPWTEGTFLDSLESADRSRAERLFELNRREAAAWRWFGARPGGAIFFHPDGLDYAPLRILVKDGTLMGQGTWTSYPAIKYDEGFADMAAFLSQDHRSSPARFVMANLDVEELWQITLQCSAAINVSAPAGRRMDRPTSKTAEVMSAVNWPDEFVHAETALRALYDIVVDETAEGKKVPYQYLVLLWAISAELRDVIQPLPYSTARDELRTILDRFAVSTSRPNPANPWFALRQSPWWSMPNPVARYKDVPSVNAIAGLSSQIRRLIATDRSFAGRAVAEIATILSGIVDDASKIQKLVEDLGLRNLRIYRLIPVESNTAETFAVNSSELTEVERTREEARLQNTYRAHLEAQGHIVYSVDIPVDGTHLRADLYDSTEDELIEVKSSIDRNTIRLGLGQILDYASIVQPRHLTLLLPESPARSLVQLMCDHGVRVVYRTSSGHFQEVGKE